MCAAVIMAMSGCGGNGASHAGDGSGEAASAPAGGVSVRLDADRYDVGDVVRVTVTNGTGRPVYTEDFKTACSIVTLQRADASRWTDILGCQLGRPTATVTVAPGAAHEVELDPASFHLTSDRAGPAFGAGTYRVAFTYRLERATVDDEPLSVSSPEFAVR
jgi:hypothetical protein